MRSTARTLFLITFLVEMPGGLALFAVSRDIAERDLGGPGSGSVLELGWIGGVNALMLGAFSLISGRLSDRFGRARLMYCGQAALILGLIGCLVFEYGDPLYLPAFWLLGASLGLLYAPLIAWLSQDPDANELRGGIHRSLILFCVSWNLGFFAASMSGGYLFLSGRRAPLALALALSLINVALLVFTVRRERTRSSSPQPQRSALSVQKQVLSGGFAILAWIANTSGTFAWSMVIYLLPALMVKLHYDPDEHGSMVAATRVVVIFVYCVMYFTRFWHHRFVTSAAMQLLAIAGLLTIATADTRPQLVTGMLIAAPLMGYNYFSSLYYSTSSIDHTKGAASGIHEGTIALGFGAGSILGGFFGVRVGPHLDWLGDLAAQRAPYILGASVIAAALVLQAIYFLLRVQPMRRRVMAASESAELATATSD
ncbi:MAG: hypothetical protein CMJ49_03390 [Planctomycetaceae bacterium]|nr:hypothetical protein [Planctomycetaceae bacterium]